MKSLNKLVGDLEEVLLLLLEVSVQELSEEDRQRLVFSRGVIKSSIQDLKDIIGGRRFINSIDPKKVDDPLLSFIYENEKH